MPIGIISNSLSIVIGGIIGAVLGDKLSADFKEKLNWIFGACSMTMGISMICLMKNMPAVIFSVVAGTAIGLAIHFGDKVEAAGLWMQRLILRLMGMRRSAPGKGVKDGSPQTDGADAGAANSSPKEPDEDFKAALLTVIVLFCASGTGIYGAIVSGMSGDHSILIAKSILDLFTALIFACTLGIVVSFIALPQFLIFLLLFLCGGLIFPHTTPDMIDDFKAAGGVLLLATGFRMAKVRMFPIADMIPAMVLVMPVSWLWAGYVIPFL